MDASDRQPETGAGLHTRVVAGREVLFDGDGFLHAFEDWSEELFESLARESGLAVIDERHRRVVRVMRDYYAGNGRAPLNRQLTAGTGMSLLELKHLFPEGIKYGARRLAGLPNPKGC